MEKAIQALLATELEAFDTWNGHSLAPPCQWWISHCTKNWQGFELLIYYIQYMIHPIVQEKSPHVVVKIPIGLVLVGPKLHSTDSETYGFSPQTIGSVLHFSFQITPSNHYTPMVPAFFVGWIHLFGWLTSIEISSVTQEGPSSWMIGLINKGFEHYHILPNIGASRSQKQNPYSIQCH